MTTPARKPAPRGANKYRDSEIKKIQIAKRWAVATLPGFDDDTYRDLLQEAGNKRSCTDLDWQGRMAVLKRFEELGWKPLPVKPRPTPTATRQGDNRLGDDPQARKIRAQWWQLHQDGKVEHNTDTALCAYVKRMTGKDSLKWCSSHEKGNVIDGLKAWIERDGK
jgi:phage gp16-like protein